MRLNHDQLILMIKCKIKICGSQKKYAESIGIDNSIVSRVLSGEREPNSAILDDLGLQVLTEVYYIKRGQDA